MGLRRYLNLENLAKDMSPQKKILVTGATGVQGGGVTRHCLESGHFFYALVRDPRSGAAQELERTGAILV